MGERSQDVMVSAERTIMKITGLEVVPFETFVDRIWFGELTTDHRVVQTLTKVLTDEGAEGYYFGGHFHGDQEGLLAGEQSLIARFYATDGAAIARSR